MSASLSAARRRHPSARWAAPVDQLQERVAQFLELRGAFHADAAARVLEVRGRAGLGVEHFAARFDLDPGVLRRAEAGEVDWSALPDALRRLL